MYYIKKKPAFCKCRVSYEIYELKKSVQLAPKLLRVFTCGKYCIDLNLFKIP